MKLVEVDEVKEQEVENKRKNKRSSKVLGIMEGIYDRA